MAGLFLTLGNVVLSALEIPQDFGPLDGKQTIVHHEFPGGLITNDDLGAFPLPLSWSGIMTGTTAMARVQQIGRMRAQGADIVLSYGPFAWLGKITQFLPKAKHQWLIPYDLTFIPREDLSGEGYIPGAGASAEQSLAIQDAAFDDVVAGDDGLSLPPSLAAPASTLNTTLQQGLLGGNGTVAGIAPSAAAAIQSAVAGVQTTAAPLIASTDATQASPAIDLSARAAAIGAVVASPTAPSRYLTLINPNLFLLAAQYLGNAGLWGDIAAASGLSDPQPTGQFTIIIPSS